MLTPAHNGSPLVQEQMPTGGSSPFSSLPCRHQEREEAKSRPASTFLPALPRKTPPPFVRVTFLRTDDERTFNTSISQNPGLVLAGGTDIFAVVPASRRQQRVAHRACLLTATSPTAGPPAVPGVLSPLAIIVNMSSGQCEKSRMNDCVLFLWLMLLLLRWSRLLFRFVHPATGTTTPSSQHPAAREVRELIHRRTVERS